MRWPFFAPDESAWVLASRGIQHFERKKLQKMLHMVFAISRIWIKPEMREEKVAEIIYTVRRWLI